MFTKIYKISIDYTKCGAAGVTGYRAAFFGTYAGGANTPDLRTEANGGNVKNSSGYDFAFYSDEACTTLIPFDRVMWNGTTGAVEVFLKVNTSVIANTDFYLGVGNADISTDQQNKSGTWGATDVPLVDHFEGNSTDDSGNGNNGTDSNITYGTSNGKIQQGADFATGKIDTGSTNFPSGSGARSILVWAKPDNLTSYGIVLSYGSAISGQGFGYFQYSTTGKLIAGNYGALASGPSTTAMTAGNWHRIGITQSGTAIKYYLNGSADGTATMTNNTTLNLSRIGKTFAGWDGADGNYSYDGKYDELFLFASEISASYMTCDWNNQNSPSTFYTITDVTPAGGIYVPRFGFVHHNRPGIV